MVRVPATRAPLGKYTRQLLKAIVEKKDFDASLSGEFTWTIERESLSAVGGNLEILRAEIAQKQQAKRYVLSLRRPGSTARKAQREFLVEHELGAKLARAAEFDAAVAARS